MKDKCLSVRICRLLGGLLLPLFVLLLAVRPALAASSSSYYDWGPYYNAPQVLGFSFSSLEQLPVPAIPQDIVPPPATGLMPGSPFYFLDRLSENIQLAVTPDPVNREELWLKIAEERLSEAKTLVEQNQPALAADSASAYNNAMEAVIANMQSIVASGDPRSDSLVAKIEDTTANHTVVAQSLTFSSPPSAASVWNDITNGSQHAMDAVADATDQPTLPEELSTSLQTLKEQGLITPEESAKLYGFTSRAQVREELEKLAGSGQFPQAELAKLNTAVATTHSDVYTATVDAWRFAELRIYQTQPQPSTEIIAEIQRWETNPGDTPPPQEIRPYLYYNRAQELAREIDFGRFATEQQAEVVRFYPEAAVENPTYSSLALPTPSPSPSPTPTPIEGEPTGEPAASPSPSPSPTPVPSVTAEPYLSPYTGPLPGAPGYFFKQFGETVSFATTFSPSRRIELNMRYAEERLREANALAQEENKTAAYEATLNQYKVRMGSIVDSIKDFGGAEAERRDLAEKLELEVSRHNVVFEKGLLPPPTPQSEIYKEVVEATENAMDASADAQGRPALPQALANRLQDLKAQGIILPEEVDELTSAGSREEVREKIRVLTELGTFPPADAKKLDEGQALVSPQDYNQLVEVRKIEELQRLRAVQAEFAQTATLRAQDAGYTQRIEALVTSIDPSLIKPGDLAGREDLGRFYETLTATASARPVNSGQFPIVRPVPGSTLPERADSVLTTCPAGAVFKQFEGCVWEDTGKAINNYEQYRCSRPGEYWSFAAKTCVRYDPQTGRQDDEKPICPAGYEWSWENQSCQTGGTIPSPKPIKEISPDEQDKACPGGATYEGGKGCVWNDTGRSVTDGNQYRCTGNTYYSFEKRECVPWPEQGQAVTDATPSCPEGRIWLWGEGRCTQPLTYPIADYLATSLEAPQPSFVTPDSPFYFIKRTVENVQEATAITTQARQEIRINQARERFAEAYYYLGKGDEKGFGDVLGDYTGAVQEIYNDMPKTQGLSDEAQKDLGEKLAQASVEQNLLLQKATTLASAEASTAISAATSVTIQGVDRAADLKGEDPVPQDIKEKIEALPADMLPDDKKQELLAIDNRVEARIKLGALVGIGALNQFDTAVFDQDLTRVDPGVQTELAELQKLDQITDFTTLKEDIGEKVEKTEEIATKLDEFRKTFEVGAEIPADIRPYVRLTRIDEISQTVRPDVVRLEDFGNRKDVQLAVATLQQEFKPVAGDFRRVEDFRRSNPGRLLPPDLARIEALSFSIGVRDSAGTCFLPSPPFAPNTPCPATGASIPIASYYSGGSSFPGIGGFGAGRTGDEFRPGWPGGPSPSVDKDGKPLVYGKGPESTKPGSCPDGYHWMYDSGGWCMSNGGNYSSGYGGQGYSGPTGPGYTPYSPYYSAPGYPPTSYGYQGPGTYSNFINTYSPPNYYGTAPTTYTTNPPPGTVPGTGPAPTSPGQCPSGYHWMSDSGGWCMANGGTYTGGGGGYGGVNPPQPCPAGASWSSYSNSCVSGDTRLYPGGYPGDGGYSSPSSYQYGCSPGYYWDGSKCTAGNYEGGNWSDTTARSGSWCQPPSSGCGSSSYWDYGSCSCRGTTYTGTGGSGTGSCYPPSGGCGSGWWDNASCSCKQASSQGCYNVSASSCGSGFYWDSGACTCRSSSTSTYTAPSSGGSSSGSCPSGYHWMSDNGGWCMSDGTSGGGSTTTSSPAPSSSPTPESSPAPSSSPAPAPTESSPAPAPAESPAPAPSP